MGKILGPWSLSIINKILPQIAKQAFPSILWSCNNATFTLLWYRCRYARKKYTFICILRSLDQLFKVHVVFHDKCSTHYIYIYKAMAWYLDFLPFPFPFPFLLYVYKYPVVHIDHLLHNFCHVAYYSCRASFLGHNRSFCNHKLWE